MVKTFAGCVLKIQPLVQRFVGDSACLPQQMACVSYTSCVEAEQEEQKWIGHVGMW